MLHNHVHLPITRYKVFNKIIDISYALCTAMPAGNWKILHVHGHHVEHKLKNVKTRNFIKYFSIPKVDNNRWVYGILFSIKRAPVQFYVPIKFLVISLFSSFKNKQKWALYCLIDYLFIFIVFLCFINLEKVIFGIIPIYILVYIISIYIDFYTHVQSELEHQNEHIVFSNVCHSRFYNLVFWNFGFHVGHHTKPKAHWSELPRVECEMGIVETEIKAFNALNLLGFLMPVFHTWRVPKWLKTNQQQKK